MFITILAFAFVFTTFALAHEFGHFAVGKAMGVKVHEFSIGFGPRAIRFRLGETVYSLRLLPLGAFVKFGGVDKPEDPAEEIAPDDARSFTNKSVPARALIIAAGPVMNFVAAFVLFSVVFLGFGVPTVQVKDVIKGSRAELAGLKARDRIILIDDQRVDGVADVRERIMAHPGESMSLTVLRDGVERTIQVTPAKDPETGSGVIGVVLEEPWVRASIIDALGTGARYTVNMSRSLVVALGRMITGRMKAEVAGPIGIAQMVGESARLGLFNLLFLAAVLNVNLGLLNLLPIPVLDGGWLLFLVIEALRRRPLNQDQEAFARLIGMAVLMLILLFATFSDIMRLVRIS
ncbi:MAG TPA: RIP metalloprotease RseP [Firmicutes bacterium]|nr:RIP metalloprotease RseP [Bacillota bacterium]